MKKQAIFNTQYNKVIKGKINPGGGERLIEGKDIPVKVLVARLMASQKIIPPLRRDQFMVVDNIENLESIDSPRARDGYYVDKIHVADRFNMLEIERNNRNKDESQKRLDTKGSSGNNTKNVSGNIDSEGNKE